ncbi:hypothetical protein RRG08_024487 [Elysia crispata]|uniref:Uncharacterized protein n=1 Tax=Elysia crispata TaxID=231223 RepID=A0AAE1D237_9GAST|nr:hypothetical protein RRG08_024487 [Elysia crispata]
MVLSRSLAFSRVSDEPGSARATPLIGDAWLAAPEMKPSLTTSASPPGWGTMEELRSLSRALEYQQIHLSCLKMSGAWSRVLRCAMASNCNWFSKYGLVIWRLVILCPNFTNIPDFKDSRVSRSAEDRTWEEEPGRASLIPVMSGTSYPTNQQGELTETVLARHSPPGSHPRGLRFRSTEADVPT